MLDFAHQAKSQLRQADMIDPQGWNSRAAVTDL
jgi:hypothetical protein